MKIVIDIPEEDYKFIKDLQFYNSGRRSGRTIEQHIINGIRNGTPLPKGHGDLIDLDALKGKLWWVTDCPHIKLEEQALEIWKEIDATKTVIPSDK